MTTVTVSEIIQAPPARVFDAVANVERLPERFEEVVKVSFVGKQRQGRGTRFVETRNHRGKTMETELEVAEYEPDHRLRMVTDSHGTVWDTVFTVEPLDGATRLTITMQARPHALLPKLLNPLMKGMFRKGIAGHLTTVKALCEAAL